MQNLLVVIPAIKKNAVIPDQLIKKLDGITLIQRAIDLTKQIVSSKNILVITDSQEISLIAARNDLLFYYDSKLKLNSEDIINDLLPILQKHSNSFSNILIYRANTPLIDKDVIFDAYKKFLANQDKTIISVKEDYKNIYKLNNNRLELLQDIKNEAIFEEVKSFIFLSFNSLANKNFNNDFYVLPHDKSIEIESYQDWWVCEKILKQKRIVFAVVGSIELGMGHIYHSLSLAHEITDHEVLFVCDEKYKIAVSQIAATDYRVIATDNPLETILELKPSLVINDILNTDEEYVLSLKENGIAVVNFEDLGSGTKHADLVINEIYEEALLDGEQYLWGHRFITLRDEFENALPHEFTKTIDSILITCGGTDQNNATMFSLLQVIDICKKQNIKIYIVCGAGYLYKNELEEYVNKCGYKNMEVTYASGVISKIMEKTQIAIASNGRTVYELADMNIPAIIISHHEREATHGFAKLENGFIHLGVFTEISSSDALKNTFLKLIEDYSYRQLLFLNVRKFSFRENKKTIVKMLMDLIK